MALSTWHLTILSTPFPDQQAIAWSMFAAVSLGLACFPELLHEVGHFLGVLDGDRIVQGHAYSANDSEIEDSQVSRRSGRPGCKKVIKTKAWGRFSFWARKDTVAQISDEKFRNMIISGEICEGKK